MSNITIENTNTKSANPKYSKLHIKIPDAIVVTYSWSATSQGICGHNFEAYEITTNLINKNINGRNITYLIPDNDLIASNVKEAVSGKYNNYDLIKGNIINGKPEVLTTKTVIICDGQLPTKGIINAKKLVMILCAKEPKWTNITMFTGELLELWYDDRVGYNIEAMVESIKYYRPDIKITLKSNYIKRLAFSIYKNTSSFTNTNFPNKRYLVYATGNCRDIYNADQKYKSDTMKEIKDILNQDILESKELLIIGWNPNYNIEEKLFFNNHKDQKMYEDRKRASMMAADLSDYFDCEVSIIPECDLPIDDILNQFDTYIYTPTEKNWDCSSRLIPECKYFGKDLILTPTVKKLINGIDGMEHVPANTALKIRIEDSFPQLLR